MEIVYMDKEPTSKNMSDITITKAQFTGASTVKEEDPDNDPTGFVINVRVSLFPILPSFLTHNAFLCRLTMERIHHGICAQKMSGKRSSGFSVFPML